MESSETRVCQCRCVPNLSAGIVRERPPSVGIWLKLTLKRSLGDKTKRLLKRRWSELVGRVWPTEESSAPIVAQTAGKAVSFVAGDMVRVRSEEEIRAMLNAWNELKGCKFMEEQQQYCGTVQRILKPVERFVDERDYRVKKAKGLVLLDGLICQGTHDYGRCDRACFYFWREEWLEKIS
jgi:hypothetical protein